MATRSTCCVVSPIAVKRLQHHKRGKAGHLEKKQKSNSAYPTLPKITPEPTLGNYILIKTMHEWPDCRTSLYSHKYYLPSPRTYAGEHHQREERRAERADPGLLSCGLGARSSQGPGRGLSAPTGYGARGRGEPTLALLGVGIFPLVLDPIWPMEM